LYFIFLLFLFKNETSPSHSEVRKARHIAHTYIIYSIPYHFRPLYAVESKSGYCSNSSFLSCIFLFNGCKITHFPCNKQTNRNFFSRKSFKSSRPTLFLKRKRESLSYSFTSLQYMPRTSLTATIVPNIPYRCSEYHLSPIRIGLYRG